MAVLKGDSSKVADRVALALIGCGPGVVNYVDDIAVFNGIRSSPLMLKFKCVILASLAY